MGTKKQAEDKAQPAERLADLDLDAQTVSDLEPAGKEALVRGGAANKTDVGVCPQPSTICVLRP